VNERTEASGGEQREHLLPGLAAFGIAVSTHRHATEPKPAEKEQGRVKIRDWPRQSSHQAYLAMVAEGFNDFRQKRAADIVDRQVHPARRYRYFKGLTPERVLRIERGLGTELAKALRLFGAARKGQHPVAHGRS